MVFKAFADCVFFMMSGWLPCYFSLFLWLGFSDLGIFGSMESGTSEGENVLDFQCFFPCPQSTRLAPFASELSINMAEMYYFLIFKRLRFTSIP